MNNDISYVVLSNTFDVYNVILKMKKVKNKCKDFIRKETKLKEVTYVSVSLFRSLFVEAQLAAGWVHALSGTYLSVFN